MRADLYVVLDEPHLCDVVRLKKIPCQDEDYEDDAGNEEIQADQRPVLVHVRRAQRRSLIRHL